MPENSPSERLAVTKDIIRIRIVSAIIFVVKKNKETQEIRTKNKQRFEAKE